MSRKIKISVLSGSRFLKSTKSPRESFKRIKDYWREQIEKVASNNPDFIVFPESCDMFLDMSDTLENEYLQYKKNKSTEFFNGLSSEYNTAVVYNIRHNNQNTTFVHSRRGESAGSYIKSFLIQPELEAGIKPGSGATVFAVDSIKRAGFATCFDLNFEELRNEYVQLNPEIIFFNSMYHGGFVQRNWAYSTRAFFVSSVYGKESGIIAPNGRELVKTTDYTDYCTAEINLDCKLIHLDYHFDKLDAMKRKYGQGVVIDDVGYLASVLVSCELQDKTIYNLIDEFDLMVLDDYLDKARKMNAL